MILILYFSDGLENGSMTLFTCHIILLLCVYKDIGCLFFYEFYSLKKLNKCKQNLSSYEQAIHLSHYDVPSESYYYIKVS